MNYFPNWCTATVSVLLPAVIVMVAVRPLGSVLRGAVTVILPLPVPEEAETVHQLWLLLTVQSVLEVIVNGEVPPALGIVIDVGATVRVGAGVTVSKAVLLPVMPSELVIRQK